MTRNYWLYLGLRVLAGAMRYVPLRLVYGVASLAGHIAFYGVAPARRALLANLSVVLAAPPTDRRVQAAAREAFVTDAKNWVDTLRIPRVTRDQVLGLVDVDGWHNLERALQRKRGAILVTAHLGNIDFVGQLILARGLKLTMPVERMEPESLFRWLTESRRSQGIDIVPVDKAPLSMLRALRRGEPVGIAGDRNVAGREVVIPFFGRPARLPVGPAALARRQSAPMLVAVGIRLPSNRFLGVIEPVPLEFTGDDERDDRDNTVRVAGILERLIRQYPGQWLVFSRVWDGDIGVGEADTIGQRTRTEQ